MVGHDAGGIKDELSDLPINLYNQVPPVFGFNSQTVISFWNVHFREVHIKARLDLRHRSK